MAVDKTKYDEISSDNSADFIDEEVAVFKTPKGLNEETVREISKIKGEPDWMLEYRLKSLKCFLEKPMPTWGVDLSDMDFDEYTYYLKPSDHTTDKWEEVPETIKNTFNKLGIPEAEQKFLAGASAQYESEVVYHNMLEEVREKGVIFLDIDSGLREYPEIFKKYFDTVIPYNEYEGTGTGFSFTNYNADEMLKIINYSKEIYYDHRDDWNKMVVRGMKEDFSWDKSAEKYMKLYNLLLGY
jgi:Fe-S cluster assembly protein SufB